MDIKKFFVLFLFIVIPTCILSQQQYSLLSLMINDAGDVALDVRKDYLTEKNGIIYDSTGEPCDGFHTDYYDKEKRKMRVTGRFRNGLPTGTVRGYHENGVIKFSYIPYGKKYKYFGRKYNYCLYKEYSENGSCIRYTDDIKGVERKYNVDGSLISVLYYLRKRSGLTHYEDYYAGGKKKTVISDGNKFDYDENGRLRRFWTRKSEKYDKKIRTMAATFYFEEYDVMGDVSRTGRFYTNLYEHDQWLHISPEFPKSIDCVPSQDYREILFPRLGLKDLYRWDYANNKTIITRYKQQGKSWVETERRTLPRLTSNE